MTLLKLDVYSVRNIQKQSFLPSPAINFIYGDNASGKSSILEAIFILGRAKSFRATSIKSVIHFDRSELIVAAQIEQASGAQGQLGVQMDGKNFSCRINQQSSTNRADLASAFPLQLIHPKSYELLDAGPQIRREFLDWGVFNDDEQFLPAWRKLKKALSQRNALLKTKQARHINVWDKELAYYGTIVNEYRQCYVNKLRPVFTKIITKFLNLERLDIKFLSGWDDVKPLQQALIEDLDKDLRYGFTHSGPHRGDFQLLVNNRLAKEFVSRGQLKILVLSLKLAQVQLLLNGQQRDICILIDDFSAELDLINRGKLLDYLNTIGCQVFITATEVAEFGDLTNIKNSKMFHVNCGTIEQV
jgi:DNA replication and repair protein RecF